VIRILDTDVISALRRPDRAPAVARWLGRQAEDSLYLSAITIGEVARGIALQRPRNPAFAGDLGAWLDRTLLLFADRILPFGAAEAQIWGGLSARPGHAGADLQIAATALVRDAVVVTRNTADYAPTGVRLENPFDPA
jgi:predicted nucleic acid-binding protein